MEDGQILILITKKMKRCLRLADHMIITWLMHTVQKPDVLELEAKTHLTGVVAALQMASKKGFIDLEKKAAVRRKGDSKTIIEGLGTRDW